MLNKNYYVNAFRYEATPYRYFTHYLQANIYAFDYLTHKYVSSIN